MNTLYRDVRDVLTSYLTILEYAYISRVDHMWRDEMLRVPLRYNISKVTKYLSRATIHHSRHMSRALLVIGFNFLEPLDFGPNLTSLNLTGTLSSTSILLKIPSLKLLEIDSYSLPNNEMRFVNINRLSIHINTWWSITHIHRFVQNQPNLSHIKLYGDIPVNNLHLLKGYVVDTTELK